MCHVLFVDYWLFVVYCLMSLGCWLLLVGCWLLVVGCWLLVIAHWLLVLVVGCCIVLVVSITLFKFKTNTFVNTSYTVSSGDFFLVSEHHNSYYL